MNSLSASKDTKPKALTKKIPADRYREQYGVIVICADEKHQKRVYEQLFKNGFKCKVVVT